MAVMVMGSSNGNAWEDITNTLTFEYHNAYMFDSSINNSNNYRTIYYSSDKCYQASLSVQFKEKYRLTLWNFTYDNYNYGDPEYLQIVLLNGSNGSNNIVEGFTDAFIYNADGLSQRRFLPIEITIPSNVSTMIIQQPSSSNQIIVEKLIQ